jgi:hypothetical protein
MNADTELVIAALRERLRNRLRQPSGAEVIETKALSDAFEYGSKFIVDKTDLDSIRAAISDCPPLWPQDSRTVVHYRPIAIIDRILTSNEPIKITQGLPAICPACGRGEDGHSYSEYGRICKPKGRA